ncbi:Cation/hydrogen exchanger 15-like protein [Hibiscus syriacus]|uniref:Cation/hydrogen exchanger 15-like protein n=1 Tax=Hibiscus syriacus TaxID=106335 RepID=A0A6A3B9R1_HIBSY|nr:Cation/hydrogen exchanger 15-like protein [Hibiscus syriacus]
MGACCSTECTYKGRRHGKPESEERDERGGHGHGHHDDDDNNITSIGHNGAIIRLQGSSSHTSMYTRKGKKNINQDAMTVWENFTGEKNMFFCGVFDGHGPSGHKVARHVSEALPLKLSTVHRPQPRHGAKKESDNDESHKQWEADFMRSFQELDQDLSIDDSLDSYCSGTTAVTLVKLDHHLIIANLGDSRAILGTRDNNNQLFPVQLTVDLKPSIPSEAERIQKNGGRVFAMEEEPNVLRVWMQDQDCPGLAMSRALVMATDGVWDVLSNNKVIQIVASVKRQSIAAKVLVYYAVQAWRTKYPGSKVDDCAVVCLFFKKRHHSPSASVSDISMQTASQIDIPDPDPKGKKTEEGETVIDSDIVVDRKMLEEVNRANAYKRSRLGSSSRHKTSGDFGGGTQS